MDNNTVSGKSGVYDSYMSSEYAYQEKQRNTENNKKKKTAVASAGSKKSFIVGLIVIAFALTGVIFAVSSAVRFFSAGSEKKQAAVADGYNPFLIPVAAIDPDGFDDVTNASMKELVHIAMWSIIGSDMEPSKYTYTDDELVIPAADVEQAFVRYFGSQIAIQHLTIEGYGYEFKYDREKNVYTVPLTTITPVYTPKVTAVDTRGGATVITCGLINSNVWMQDHKTGDILSPEPDKFIKVTLREFGGERYISSIQASGTPETAVPNVNVYTTIAPVESTTEEETYVITRN